MTNHIAECKALLERLRCFKSEWSDQEYKRWAESLAALLKQCEWQPIETAPFNEDVLVFAPDSTDSIFICHRVIFVGQTEGDWDGGWYEQNVDACPSPVDVKLTKWLPLPPE